MKRNKAFNPDHVILLSANTVVLHAQHIGKCMYTISRDEESLLIEKDGQPLLTPMMRPVKMVSRPLADRLLEDLAAYGEDPSNLMSLVAFQYPMIDFFLSCLGKSLSIQSPWVWTVKTIGHLIVQR